MKVIMQTTVPIITVTRTLLKSYYGSLFLELLNLVNAAKLHTKNKKIKS